MKWFNRFLTLLDIIISIFLWILWLATPISIVLYILLSFDIEGDFLMVIFILIAGSIPFIFENYFYIKLRNFRKYYRGLIKKKYANSLTISNHTNLHRIKILLYIIIILLIIIILKDGFPIFK